jgi:tetratricopeptide (TPR) repeat protein
MALLLACAVKLVAEISLWRGQTAIDARDHKAAERWLAVAGVVVRIPLVGTNEGEYYFQSARLNRRLGRFDQVSADLRQALSNGWDKAAIEREQWIALAQTGRFDRMSTHLGDLLTDAGSDGPEICKAYVVWLMSRFDLAAAHRVVDVWQQDYPESAEPYFQRGRMFSVRNDWPAAVEQFSNAILRDPGRADARLMRANAQIQLVRYAEALSDLEVVLATTPDHVEAAVDFAECQSNLGKPEEACDRLRKLLKKHPDEVEALSLLGRIELKRGNYEEALTSLQSAVELRPIDSDARYSLGKVLRLLGRDKEAEEHFNFVAESTRAMLKLGQVTEELLKEPDNVELRYQVGKLTWKWRSRDGGVRWLRSVLDYDPGHVETHKLLAQHYRESGDEERALHHEKAAESMGSN